MPIAPISRVRTITYRVGITQNIETIYQTNLVIGSEYQPGHKIISFNAFIKNLKIFASVPSLPEAPLPSFAPTDTSTQKTMKVLDVEWKSSRKQMNVFISSNINNVPDWHKVGSVSLLNPYGYPFRIYNLMDLFTDNLALELGENSRIGVQMQDVGYGLLTNTDEVTIHGSYTEEIFVISEDKDNIYNFEIVNNVTGGGTGGGGSNSGGSTTPPTTTNNLINNSNTVDNTSKVGN